MGYRSDVKCITTKEGFALIDKLVRKASGITKDNEDEEYWLTDGHNTQQICEGKYVLMEYEDIKWYEGYDPAVSAFMRGLEKLEDKNVPYRFGRVGEDYTDVDFREAVPYSSDKWNDMPRLEVYRKIEVEY